MLDILSKDAVRPLEVAVVIPCYNAAHYIARALDSVFAQTYRDYRVYVIDDGSTDSTLAALKSYAGRIVILRMPHAGQGPARNHGIRMSDAPYIAFLDADDEWLPHKLERQLNLLRSDFRIGMVYSDCANNTPGLVTPSFFDHAGQPPSGRVFREMVEKGGVFTPTVVVRRDCLEDVGLFNESLAVGEDYDLWLRIAARWNVAVVSEVLAVRHPSPESLSLTTSVEVISRSGIACFEALIENTGPMLRSDELEALRKSLADRCYRYGAYLLERGDRSGARSHMRDAMRRGRRDWRVLAKFCLTCVPHYIFVALRKLKGWAEERRDQSARSASGQNP